MLGRRGGHSYSSFLFPVLCLSISFFTVQISFLGSYASTNRSISQSYMVHNPIGITNDGELAAVATSGTGSLNDPYIIAGWNITGASRNGIYITGTTKYFRIENCWIDGSAVHGIFVDNVTSGTPTIVNNTYKDYNFSTVANNTCNNNIGSGIRIYNSISSIITNNSCNNNSLGISLVSSSSSTITNNTCTANHDAIDLMDSSFSTLTNNTCNDNGEYGIYLRLSGFSTLTNNICNDNGEGGIHLRLSSISTLTSNTCSDNHGDGMSIDSSGSSILSNNICNNNSEYGISLYDSNSVALANNTCNDNGVGNIFSYTITTTTTTTTTSTTSGTETSSINSLLSRIELFLFVFGLLLLSLFFVNRRTKSV